MFGVVRFSNPVNARLSGMFGLGLVAIRDDDQPTVVPGAVSVTEGNEGLTEVEVPVTLTAASSEPVTVPWETTIMGSDLLHADENDFEAASGTVTFEPGETSKTVTVSVVGDTDSEHDEMMAVRFGAPPNARLGGLYGLGIVTILNDDEPPQMVITPGVASVIEGNSGTTTQVEVPVTLNVPATAPVTVSWETVNRSDPGFASVGDFVAASGTVTFQPGETTRTVTIEVVGDDRAEPDEYVVIRFSEPEGAMLGGFFGLGFVGVTDDD